MDPETSLDYRDRAVSSEPTSTRPNPFVDTDKSSRKRRRTSMSASGSGSPAKSVDIVNLIPDSPSSGTLDGDAATSENTEPTKIDTDSISPQTPENPCRLSDTPLDAPSSMVTINLRKIPDDELMSSPQSPTIDSKDMASDIPPGKSKASVESEEVDIVPTSIVSIDTPQSSSLRNESPPIEIITVQSDDEMSYIGEESGVSIIQPEPPSIDLLQQFPYRGPDESLISTLHRLTAYLTDEPNIDEHVLNSFQQWLGVYVRHVETIDVRTAHASCRQNREFWMNFPDIIYTMLGRRPSMLRSPTLHGLVMDFFAVFARLAAWFIIVDLDTVRDLAPEQLQEKRRPFDLFSHLYLQQLHTLVQARIYGNHLAETDLPSPRSDDALYLLNEFSAARGGKLGGLANLIKGILDLVPTYPKLVDCLSHLCQFAADLTIESAYVLRMQTQQNPQAGTPMLKNRLELGHRLHNQVLDTLLMMIEKHVTQLNGDNVSCCMHALVEMLRSVLRGAHEMASDLRKRHQTANPSLPDKYTIDAIVWEERFDVLVKLIRSSQMQLRVMAVTAMCSDLVTNWKRFSESAEEGKSVYLDHLADYLIRSRLVEYILGPTCHPEITAEGGNIIGFLVVTKSYREEHTDLLWQGITSSQDPRNVDALTRLMSQITNLFDYPNLLGFCRKLQTLPIESYTPAIRSLWDNITRQIIARSTIDGLTLDFSPYELCLRLLRESSICRPNSPVAYPELQRAALQKFSELMGHKSDEEIRQQVYSTCIEDIEQKSSTTLGSLWGLSVAIRPSTIMIPAMHSLTEKHDLAKLIIEELEHAIEVKKTTGVEMVLAGGVNQPRREFIANIIQIEPLKINAELGQRLWDILVGPRSSCLADREAGWAILNATIKGQSFINPFLQSCLSSYLPALPSFCFCEGMLYFVRAALQPRVDESNDLILDDEEAVAQSGIEQLWRLILEADNVALVEASIGTMVDIYINSRHILTNPLHRNQQIHLALVNRCLHQLKDAARTLSETNDGNASGDEESMVIVTTEEQIRKQERVFIRSLQLLRIFLENHRLRPQFATPDLRTLISDTPYHVEGDSAELKYQSFDGDNQTDVKPLRIGQLNTAASLLASIRDETGFTNYRLYYRGRPFAPNELTVCKSLRDLRIQDGLILVKREDDKPIPTPIKPGASVLEIEISAHFDELWEYLSMEESLAKEIYYFLIKLPTNGHVLKTSENDISRYKAVFPPGQPYKSLYAIHALSEHIDTITSIRVGVEEGLAKASHQNHDVQIIEDHMSLIVQAISDENIVDRASAPLKFQLLSHLTLTFNQFINRLNRPPGSWKPSDVDLPTPSRLIDIIVDALASPEEIGAPVVLNSMAVILQLASTSGGFWDRLGDSSEFASLLQRVLLLDSRKMIRSRTAQQIQEVIQREWVIADNLALESSNKPANLPLTQFFWPITLGLVPLVANAPMQCEEVFKLTHFFLVQTSVGPMPLIDIPGLATKTGELLLAHTCTEDVVHAERLDMVARGLTLLLHKCLQIHRSLPLSRELPENLAQSLMRKHLYPEKRAQTEQPVPRVVLDEDTRTMLCEIVFQLVKHDKEKVRSILQELNCLLPFYVEEEDDPYLYELPFHFERCKALRSPCGYVGLQNLSNTCYLNSLLTQLFMNTGFRQFMLDARVQDAGVSQQLLFYTQQLFGYMQESYRRFIDPSNFVSSIKAYDDSGIDIHNQMDVDEFYNLLFDRWEGQLLQSNEKKKLRSFYGGQLVQQVKSKECDHISERLEPFSAIQCDIKGKSCLEESLQAYVDGEILEGDNKYKCSTCDRHVDAVKRACLKDIPDNVIFHLKRFDFNLRTLQRSKINDYFSFPGRINLRPYTVDHLTQPSNEDGEDIFELVGVLVHAGTAESGHYYSYIRERPTSHSSFNWVEFNDDMVTPWDPATMEDSTFGGPDRRPTYETNGIVYDKSYSAYMLFYQRASSLKSEQDLIKVQTPSPFCVDMPMNMKEHILDENTVLLRRHCLFGTPHVALVKNLFSQAKLLLGVGQDQAVEAPAPQSSSGRQRDEHLRALAMQVALSHLDQIVSRAKDTPDLLVFAKMVESTITHPNWAFQFYDYFNRRHVALRALLQRNPDPGTRTFISNSLASSLGVISRKLCNLYDSSDSHRVSPTTDEDDDDFSRESETPMGQSVLEGTMSMINHLWRYFYIHIKAWDEFFGLVLEFAKLGRHEIACLLGEDFLSKVLQIVSADSSMDLATNYARMLHNVLRRSNARPPSYVAIIKLISYLMDQLPSEIGSETIVDDLRERIAEEADGFTWTSDEVRLLHESLDGQPGSLFVEKLLAIDQAHDETDNILKILTRASAHMDTTLLRTFKYCIQGETSAQIMDPFLRGAGAYLENTARLDHATKIINHIHNQVGSLQGTEAIAFLDFMERAMYLDRSDLEFKMKVRLFALELVPKWAPFLLPSSESVIRSKAEYFLKEGLDKLANSAPTEQEEGEEADARRQLASAARESLRHLGLQLLMHLQENHVEKRMQLGKESLAAVLRVLERCADAYRVNPTSRTDVEADFFAMQSEVMGAVRGMIINEVDEDGSDWEGSCGTSEQAYDVVELNTQTVNDVNEMDLA